MRRCQVFNISAGVSVPSFAIKPGMSFYAGLRERGEHILEYVFWGVFRSLLWHVPFTINSTLFSYPLRVNGMGGVHPPPMPPGIALKTAAARYAPLRLHLADRAGLDVPVSTDPLTTVLAVSPGCAPAFPPVHLSRRKQSRAEPHENGIFHRTHAPKYENYFRANHRLPASPWSTINKKKAGHLKWPA